MVFRRDRDGTHGPLERSPPLPALRRYYPGFFGALFLILLRVAIGWHFTYEGLYKLDPPQGSPPFSAESYFRAASGPFAPHFRSLLPDAAGREILATSEDGLPTTLRERWRADLDQYATHYNFDADQLEQAETSLDQALASADAWFRDPANSRSIDKYFDDLDRVESLENDPDAMEFQAELAHKDRRTLEQTRRELTAPIDAWTSALKESWNDLATEDQIDRAGEYAAPWQPIEWLNAVTVWGLIIAGTCLMLGLLTPVAALWCAGFLTMIYFSNPPWPWLPANPVSEGHYRFVDKNLIELLACLVLASTPSGLWVGLDALLFGWMDRRRAALRQREELEVA